MADYTLVGRCGLYCGSCPLYRAHRDRGEYLHHVSKEWEMPLERIRCEGCHALTPNCAGSQCKIVHCLNSKGFEYCFECLEYEHRSCQKFEESAKKCADANVDLRDNLERIKTGEVEVWLKECEEKFRCAECGKPLPVFKWISKKACYHCGFDLSELTQNMRVFKGKK